MCSGKCSQPAPAPAPAPTTPTAKPVATRVSATAAPVASTGSGAVLYSSTGTKAATYYYSTNMKCAGEPNGYPELGGYPSCASFTPGPDQQTLGQLNTNNIVAIDSGLLSSDHTKFCGKQINIYYNKVLVTPPEPGSWMAVQRAQAVP
eukprot:17761-Heterococcus_DN1.PRE.1